jgi:CBS domain-containing protein
MICPACGSENIDGSDRCENCLAPFRDLDVPRADSAEGLARQVMRDTLSELEQDTAVIVAPDTRALDVATRMREHNTGCALVMDGSNLVGIFTEHDLLLSISQQLPDPGRASDAQAHAADAASPVYREDNFPIPNATFGDTPIEEIRLDESLVEETSVEANADTRRNRLNFLSVLDRPVKEMMTSNPETLQERESVASALNKMSTGHYRHIPVRQTDNSYTVVSIKSVLNYIAQEDW